MDLSSKLRGVRDSEVQPPSILVISVAVLFYFYFTRHLPENIFGDTKVGGRGGGGGGGGRILVITLLSSFLATKMFPLMFSC